MKQTFIFSLVVATLMVVACKPKTATPTVTSVVDTIVVAECHLDIPDSALVELKAGNDRYVKGQSTAFQTLTKERTASATKQKPFAIVVSCSDSRVPPEEVFDQGVSELFVIRTAGGVLDKAVLGSIEYAAEHLGVRLIVVLGHERCGAVTASVESGEAAGNIGYIVEQIKPAVESAQKLKGDLLNNAIHENMSLIQHQIATAEPVLKELTEKGELKIVGAYYDLDEGTVTF